MSKSLPLERIDKKVRETGLSLFTVMLLLDVDPYQYDLAEVSRELKRYRENK